MVYRVHNEIRKMMKSRNWTLPCLFYPSPVHEACKSRANVGLMPWNIAKPGIRSQRIYEIMPRAVLVVAQIEDVLPACVTLLSAFRIQHPSSVKLQDRYASFSPVILHRICPIYKPLSSHILDVYKHSVVPLPIQIHPRCQCFTAFLVYGHRYPQESNSLCKP